MTSDNRSDLEALAAEGLDYFEKAGDDGDKVYVRAIRKLLSARPPAPARVPEGWTILIRPDDGHLAVSGPHGGLCPDPNSPRLAERTLHALGTALLAAPAPEADAKAVMACHSDLAAALVARAKWGRGGQFSPAQDTEGTCKVMELAAENIRCLQLAVATAWDEGYRMGVNDERESEANIGIAGFGMKVEPARANPYSRGDAHPAPEPTEPLCAANRSNCTYPACGCSENGAPEPAEAVKQGEGREGVEELAITLAEDVRTALDRQSCPDHYMRIAYETVESAVIRRLSSAPQPSIPGEVVQVGDDDDGQPRIVIHTTREAIRDYPALLFKRVQVSAQPASADHSPGAGKMGDSAQQAGNRPATGTVADISDEELLRRAVATVAKQRGRQYAWARIMDVFMLRSTYSAQLCRRFDIDPDTGKTAQRTGSRGEVGDA